MGVVIPLQDLSRTIVRTILRDAMRADVANPAGTIRDPKSATRPGKSGFVLTAFPDRDPYFPNIIVEEMGRSGGRIERTSKLAAIPYTVRIEIVADSSTHLFTLRDQIHRWLNQNLESFSTQGWHDVEVLSSTPTTWDPTSVTKTWQIQLRGVAYGE